MESSNRLPAVELIQACVKKDIAKVEQLLDTGASPSELVSHYTENGDRSALHLVCAKKGDLPMLKVLTSGVCDVDVRDFNGCTPLHYACFNGHIELVTYLVGTLKCNPNVKDNEGKTPLHMACSFCLFSKLEHLSLRIVCFLTLIAGCDCNVVTNKGETPLMLLCRNSGSRVIINHLVHACHCNMLQKDNDGNTALHLACSSTILEQGKSKAFIERRYLQVVETITATGETSGMYSFNNNNDCPLEIAIANDFIHIASFLIIEMNKISTDEHSVSPLHIACKKWNIKLLTLLKTLNYIPDKMGNTPLHIVCKNGYLESSSNFLKKKHTIFAQNSKGELPIQLAIRHNHLAIVHKIWECKLLDFKERLRLVQNMEGFAFHILKFPENLLHYACGKQNGYSNLIALKVLKEYYCCIHNRHLIDNRDKCGNTPLHYACSNGLYDIMVYLINDYKADVTIQTSMGDSLLHLISAALNVLAPIYDTQQSKNLVLVALKMIKDLLAYYNCDPNKTSPQKGNTPLMCLAGYPYKRVQHTTHYYAIYVFVYNSDLTIQNNVGDTALHIACQTGNDLVVQQIIVTYRYDCRTALLAMKNFKKRTPLHLACLNGRLNIVNILIRCAVNCGQYEVDNDNCTSFQLAIANKHYRVASALLRVMDPKLDETQEKLFDDACKNEDIQLIQCLAKSSYRSTKSVCGDTLLHIACEINNSNLCEFLLEIYFGVNETNNNGDTPLHIACQFKSIQSCLVLIKAACDINIQNKNGDTPLHIACHIGSPELCEVLLEANCDINIRNRNGDTPLHLAFSGDNFEVAQILISDPQVNVDSRNTVGDTLLHIACRAEYCTPQMVNYVLAVVKSDPNTTNNDGMKPIQLTTNAQKIHELIRYGANPTDVYSTSSVKMSTKNPPQPLVKIFVVGNPSVGKSTLIAALQKELSRIVKILTPAKKVSGVEEKTAGIIPCEFESKKYGQVALYDFAGQAEYYSTHAALLQNSIESSPPVFLIVVNLCDSYEEIKRTILYWLSFLENQCTSVGQDLSPHVIIVGSHADILDSKGERIQDKTCIINFIKGLPHFKSLEITDFISMDCQFSQSAGMKKLRKQLQDSCEKLRIKEEIRFNTHCFLVYLLDKFIDSTAVTLDKIFTQVCSERKIASESNPLFFLPDCLSSLFELCFELNDRGHILFLKDKQTLTNSWVVLDKQSLLNEVLGTIFAPEGLKQYCTLASNTGVVPLSKLTEKFLKYDSNMVVGFLTHLEFCHEVSDEELLQLINNESQIDSTTLNVDLKTYLFFPALIKLEAPDGIWNNKPQFVNHFGWMLRCSRPEQFFTSRFLEVLLLRLAFSCALVTDTSRESDEPSLKRKCTLWKNGIFWGDRYGVETLVEVQSFGKAVVVLMRSFQRNLTAYLQLRSRIIQKVLTTVSDFCARVNTLEYLIDPSEVKSYPLNSKTLFNAKDVFKAIVLRSACVVSEKGESLPLETLLTFDPYAYLGHKILSKMFSGDISQHKKQISDNVIARLPDQFAQKCDIISKILCHDNGIDSALSQSKDLFHSLKSWREKCDGTYHCLRQIFDQHSICAGRNLLEMAKLSPLEIEDGIYDKAIQDGEQDMQCNQTHYAELLRQLTDYATKWRLIGIHLGFRDGELDNIQGAPLLLQEAPVSWLCKMLSQWLEWVPGDSRGSTDYATLNALKAALCKAAIEIKVTLEEHS